MQGYIERVKEILPTDDAVAIKSGKNPEGNVALHRAFYPVV